MIINYQKSTNLTDLVITKGILDTLENYYPDFGYWYVNKCMPGILLNEPTDFLITAKDKTQIIGIVLGKKTKEETKLRCVRVLPRYQNKGIGIHLIEKALLALDVNKPHCTVAEEMVHQYSRPLVNIFDFSLSKVSKGMYRKNKLEYIFNS